MPTPAQSTPTWLLITALALTPLGTVTSQPPAWWSERGVLDPSAGPNNFGPANLGQLKHVATMARDEFDARLPGGAGATVDALVDAWYDPQTGQPPAPNPPDQNLAPINLGQLKAVAKPFYLRLFEESLLPAGAYPWTAATTDDANFAPANIGQLKHVFAFDLTTIDNDNDGLPDAWELQHGLDPNNPADAAGDADNDGLTNLEEFQLGTIPTNADTDGDGATDSNDLAPTINDPNDPDGDGLDAAAEAERGSNPYKADTDGDKQIDPTDFDPIDPSIDWQDTDPSPRLAFEVPGAGGLIPVAVNDGGSCILRSESGGTPFFWKPGMENPEPLPLPTAPFPVVVNTAAPEDPPELETVQAVPVAIGAADLSDSDVIVGSVVFYYFNLFGGGYYSPSVYVSIATRWDSPADLPVLLHPGKAAGAGPEGQDVVLWSSATRINENLAVLGSAAVLDGTGATLPFSHRWPAHATNHPGVPQFVIGDPEPPRSIIGTLSGNGLENDPTNPHTRYFGFRHDGVAAIWEDWPATAPYAPVPDHAFPGAGAIVRESAVMPNGEEAALADRRVIFHRVPDVWVPGTRTFGNALHIARGGAVFHQDTQSNNFRMRHGWRDLPLEINDGTTMYQVVTLADVSEGGTALVTDYFGRVFAFLPVELRSSQATNDGRYDINKHDSAIYLRPGNVELDDNQCIENALTLFFEDCADDTEITARATTQFSLNVGNASSFHVSGLAWQTLEAPPGAPEPQPFGANLVRVVSNTMGQMRGGLYRYKLNGTPIEGQVWLPLAGPDITDYWQSEITYFRSTWGPAYRAKLNERLAPTFTYAQRIAVKKVLALKDMLKLGAQLDWSGNPKGTYSPCGGPKGGESRLTIHGVVIDFRKRNNMMYALIGREMGIPEVALMIGGDAKYGIATGSPDTLATKESYRAGYDLFDGYSLETVMHSRGRRMQEPESWARREWPSWEVTAETLSRDQDTLLQQMIK